MPDISEILVQNDLLSAILAFGIVLIPAVLIHELGHFLAGKSVGITMLEFGIGFPPRIARLFTWRETEFTLNMVPLGGFVRPLGEGLVGPSPDESGTGHDPDSAADRESRYGVDLDELRARGVTKPVAVNDVAPLPRIFFLAAGALANFVMAFVLFVIIGLTGVPEAVGVRIGLVELGDDTVLAQAGVQPNDYIETINGQYFASAEELFQIMHDMDGQDVTLQIRRLELENDGPDQIFDVTVPAFEAPELPENIGNGYVYTTAVDSPSPAADAGFTEGDLIVSFNGELLTKDADPVARLRNLTRQNAGKEITLEIIRDGEPLTLTLVPRENPPEGQGHMGIRIGSQGVFPGQEAEIIYVQPEQVVPVGQPLGEAIDYGVSEFSFIMSRIIEFPVRLIEGATRPEENRIVSVVGISQMGGDILQDSVQDEESTTLLSYIALISIALGFTNLLPIPALDGGRILFVVIELVRGEPIPPEYEGVVHLVGLIFLLSIGVIFIINDIINPLTNVVP